MVALSSAPLRLRRKRLEIVLVRAALAEIRLGAPLSRVALCLDASSREVGPCVDDLPAFVCGREFVLDGHDS